MVVSAIKKLDFPPENGTVDSYAWGGDLAQGEYSNHPFFVTMFSLTHPYIGHVPFTNPPCFNLGLHIPIYYIGQYLSPLDTVAQYLPRT